MKRLYLILSLVLPALGQPPLQRYNVDRNAISVSGISAGAAMATQVHVAFSSSIMGCGIVAGMPYYCARADLIEALNVCMAAGADIDMAAIFQQTDAWSGSEIDATSNLAGKRVFVWHGSEDPTVDPEAGRKAVEFYQRYNGDIGQDFSIRAGHGFPTLDFGVPCPDTDDPYINRCNYYGAYKILNHIYGNLTRPTGSEPLPGDLLEYNQEEFQGDSDGFDSDGGYIYVPSNCRPGSPTVCRLHVVLHGCLQGREFMTPPDNFVRNTGYNHVGELNNIIMLYPQGISNLIAGNPNGCWDWWGYEDGFMDPEGRYATRNGVQMMGVKAMIDRASGAS